MHVIENLLMQRTLNCRLSIVDCRLSMFINKFSVILYFLQFTKIFFTKAADAVECKSARCRFSKSTCCVKNADLYFLIK